MTSRIRVPIWGLNKSVMISGDATKGAQIGTNLLLPDGSLATLATLAKALGVTAAVPNASPNISVTPVLWSRILGIPNRVLQPPFCDDTAAPGVDGDAIPGPRGLQGVPGIGVPGDDGYMGSDGDQGAPGPAGAASTVPGPPGPSGAPIPADDGRDGYDGDPVPGPQGAPSTVPGPAGVAGPPGDDGFVGSDGDVAIFPSAPPSALVGLIAITGNATTTMRSDAAPALDVTISPTWTGNHLFEGNPALVVGGAFAAACASSAQVPLSMVGGNPTLFSIRNTTNSVEAEFGVASSNGLVGMFTNHPFQIRTNNAIRINIAAAGNITINAPTSGIALVVNSVDTTQSIQAGITSATKNPRLFVTHTEATGLTDISFTGSSAPQGTISIGNTSVIALSNSRNVTINAPVAGVTLTVNAIAGSLGIDAQNGVRAPAIVVDRQFASEGDIPANGSCVVDDYMQLGAGNVMNIGTGGTLSIGLNPVLYLPTNGIFSSNGRLAN